MTKRRLPKPSLDDLLQLTQEVVFPFYQIERHTPLRFPIQRFENDAEHSWSLALYAAALAPHIDSGLDVGKICQFATVHDLVEIYAGDTSWFDSEHKKSSKEVRERAALQKFQSRFTALPWIAETIVEYERQESLEAKFVKSIDKVIAILFDIPEEGLFYHEHRISLDEWKSIMQKQREKAKVHAGAFEYYDQVWNYLLASPHFFHQGDK